MEELLKTHRQQQQDLQSRMTQKKKSATKKTRKGVIDECAELERQLKEQQADDLAHINGETPNVEGGNDEERLAQSIEESISIATQGGTKNVVQILREPSVSDSAASNGHAKKPNRQKARLARRAAEQEAVAEQAQREAADLPNLREKEVKSMHEAYSARGLVEHVIRSDGHCLYAAVADQLHCSSMDPKPAPKLEVDSAEKTGYALTRSVAAAYIEQNADDFEPFLEQPLREYVQTIRETGEWGGHLEILALSKAYDVDINILHGSGHIDKIESGSTENEPLWLAYYRHNYGLGEHYNSLRRKR